MAYLAGNSLGLMPRKARGYIEQELDDWGRYAVEGHTRARHPWLPYHEELTAQLARLVGGQPGEVVAMNSLTVNLHLMMVSFYRPTRERYKILVEGGAFPSDQYGVASQARLHGFTREQAIIEVSPRPGESTLREEDLHATIAREGSSLALVLLGNVNYLCGPGVRHRCGDACGARPGGAGGLRSGARGGESAPPAARRAGPDFAVWCSYKYLNGGPGTIAGAFVHERHARAENLPRLEGWWGQDNATRFQMPRDFSPLPGVEGWQLSNPPIFQLAALRASLELFDAATMPALRRKSERLTGYLEFLIDRLSEGVCRILTPREARQRGAQLSLRLLRGDPRQLVERLSAAGVVCDLREPDVIRAAPAPLYCSFHDVFRFATALESHARI